MIREQAAMLKEYEDEQHALEAQKKTEEERWRQQELQQQVETGEAAPAGRARTGRQGATPPAATPAVQCPECTGGQPAPDGDAWDARPV